MMSQKGLQTGNLNRIAKMTAMETENPGTGNSNSNAVHTWEVGADRILRYSDDSQKRTLLEGIVERIMYELEKRLGQTFSTAELVKEWRESDAWCTEIVHEAAPGSPWAWNLDVVQCAAFYRFSTRALDYQVSTE